MHKIKFNFDNHLNYRNVVRKRSIRSTLNWLDNLEYRNVSNLKASNRISFDFDGAPPKLFSFWTTKVIVDEFRCFKHIFGTLLNTEVQQMLQTITKDSFLFVEFTVLSFNYYYLQFRSVYSRIILIVVLKSVDCRLVTVAGWHNITRSCLVLLLTFFLSRCVQFASNWVSSVFALFYILFLNLSLRDTFIRRSRCAFAATFRWWFRCSVRLRLAATITILTRKHS